jgi:glycosyltransferase involved in cell wall biosynthesis
VSAEPTVCGVLLYTPDRMPMARRIIESWTGPARLVSYPNDGGKTIGALRNEANALARADILVHFDSDDWSHPNRIAEQVALLQSSGADVVGYREMLFWRDDGGEAWLYSNKNPGYALGTSLCYWRRTWERKPFPATSYGEDLQFCTGLKVCGVPAFGCSGEAYHDPRMIARIHHGNTSTAYKPENMARASEWKRVPEWDQYCRSVMG